MVTVVTHVRLREGAAKEWEAVFAQRAEAARERQGFVFVQLCRTDADAGERVIVGSWERHEDWESWHHDPEFFETRNELEHATADGTGDTQWFEVLLEQRR
jgi:heme-degrading monooxygenase HmoA